MGNPSASASAATFRKERERRTTRPHAADERPDPAKIREENARREAVHVETAKIMKTPVTLLDQDTVVADLASAAERTSTDAKSFEVKVLNAIKVYHAKDGHVQWFEENILHRS